MITMPNYSDRRGVGLSLIMGAIAFFFCCFLPQPLQNSTKGAQPLLKQELGNPLGSTLSLEDAQKYPRIEEVDASLKFTISQKNTVSHYIDVPIPKAFDHLGGTKVVLLNDYNYSKDASDFYPMGKTIITWLAIDKESGLSVRQTQEILVQTNQAVELVHNIK